MNHVQSPVSSTLSLALAAPPCEALDIVAAPTPGITPAPESVLFGLGPIPCRCGRYLSEDFDGRLFCRGCEGPDPADITSRLPLCHRTR
jgi:hypothetical protein